MTFISRNPLYKSCSWMLDCNWVMGGGNDSSHNQFHTTWWFFHIWNFIEKWIFWSKQFCNKYKLTTPWLNYRIDQFCVYSSQGVSFISVWSVFVHPSLFVFMLLHLCICIRGLHCVYLIPGEVWVNEYLPFCNSASTELDWK